MKKILINRLGSVLNEEFTEIEIDVTLEEEAELNRIAAAKQISVSELFRREVLLAENEPFLKTELVPEVLKRLRELSDAVTGRATLPPAELGEILLDLASSLEQLIGPSDIFPKKEH